MKFYSGNMFPESYRHQIFIAEHGSWNRSVPVGYQITRIYLKGNRPIRYEVFADGWLQGTKAWGRPVDILINDPIRERNKVHWKSGRVEKRM